MVPKSIIPKSILKKDKIKTKKVTFSRFEHIHRYSWIAPVDGFITNQEFTNAKLDVALDIELDTIILDLDL